MPRWTKPAVAVVLVLYLGIQLFSLNLQQRKSLGFPGRVVVWVASPLQSVVTGTVNWLGDVWHHYFYLVGVSRQQDALMAQRNDLRRKLIELKEVELENQRLREFLHLPMPEGTRWMVAERLALGASNYERVIRIGKGKKSGVRVGAAVMNTEGLVGQVVDVFSHSSDVLLLVDLASAIDVVCQRSRAKGILRGATMEKLKFEYLSKEEDVQVGDQLISSGLDGIYPAGIPVGSVMEVHKSSGSLFLSAWVKPHVDFSKIEEVAILSEVRE